jgi:hypothetical protein
MTMLLDQASAHATALLIVSHSLEQLPPAVRRLVLHNGQLSPPDGAATQVPARAAHS